MQDKGQVSIEFMLVGVALLAFMLVFMNAFSKVQDSAMLALDVQNAKRFSAELEADSGKILLMGDGSEVNVSSPIIGEWLFSRGSLGNSIIVRNKTKEIKVALPKNLQLRLSKTGFTKKISFVIKKSGGGISLED